MLTDAQLKGEACAGCGAIKGHAPRCPVALENYQGMVVIIAQYGDLSGIAKVAIAENMERAREVGKVMGSEYWVSYWKAGPLLGGLLCEEVNKVG